MRAARAAAAVAGAASIALSGSAGGDTPGPGVTVDRTVARFYTPETGGTAYPRFIFQRTLAFEARLANMAEDPDGIGQAYDERNARDALERHVVEEMLVNLADKLIADSPPDKRPSANELLRAQKDIADAILERVGGRDRVERAARAEQIDDVEVAALLQRGAAAAWYIDRAVAPILHPSDEQLRDVFRASAHPYRGRRFAQVRDALERWFVVERLRAAESAFLQAARSRVHITVTP